MPDAQSPVHLALLFADEDEAWRVALLNHLSALTSEGRITLWDVTQIAAGTDRGAALEQYLLSASVILLLVSASLLASHDREIEQALHRQKMGNILIIPILLHPVDWQNTRLSHVQPLPHNGEPITMWSNPEAAFAEVVAGIRKALPEALHLATTTAPFPTFPPIWHIPYPRNPFFTGRDELLTRLTTALKTNQATALSQAQAISGLGGIGKTQIAIEYAYQHRDEYEIVLWTLSDTRESLISGYIAIAELLNLPQKNEPDPTITIEAVKTWLQTHRSWLLTLDNADDLTIVREFIPSTFGGHLLLTTRAWTMGKLAKRLAVDTMTVDMGALLLLRLVGLVEQGASLETASSDDIAAARKICEALGGLPLALDQAGAYIEETRCGLVNYLERYRMRRAVLLQRRGGLVNDHPKPVATTWSLSFEKVEQQSPTAADLLRLCSFLAADAIAEEIITQGTAHLGPHLSKVSADPFLLDEAVALLGAYSLIQRDEKDQTFSIHRLVQAVLQDTMNEEMMQLLAGRTVQAVNAVFPDVEFATWPQCERYLPHALVCAEWVEREQISSLEAARLLYQAGRYLIERARFSEAYPLLQQALVIREQHLGPKHIETASVVDRLARCFQLQGKYKDAEPLHQRALSIREQQLGEMHPSTGASLNNLAELYRTQGKYKDAESLYQRALAICEQQLGEMHPSTAMSLNNLAELYRTQGKYKDAEPLHQRALSIREQQLGAIHPDTAMSLSNLAGLYHAQGKYKDAEPLYQRALAINEQQSGEMHPDTAASLNNLAELYHAQGKYQEAEPLYQRALAICEQQLGEMHPSTAIGLNNLATLYRKQGKYKDVEPLYQRALAIKEQQLGEMHPSTATSLYNLATLYSEQGKDTEAELLFKRALLICEQTLGETHLNTQIVQRWYISLLRKMGRDKDATALETTSKLPPKEH